MDVTSPFAAPNRCEVRSPPLWGSPGPRIKPVKGCERSAVSRCQGVPALRYCAASFDLSNAFDFQRSYRSIRGS